MEELTLIREEILKQSNNYQFNLILGEINFEKINKFLMENQKFYDCIQNICIYCKNPEKYDKDKLGNNRIFDIYRDKEKVINYIKDFSSIKLKPYPITELITYQKYLHKYKDKHYLISKYYGDLSEDIFKEKYHDIYQLIIHNFDKPYRKDLLGAFSLFRLDVPFKRTDNDIINEYTKNEYFSRLLNKCLMSPMDNKSFETIAYFASRFMYSLNSYAQKDDKYCLINEKKFYRGIKVSFATLLRYKRAKGKIIVFPSFTSTSEEDRLANMWLTYINDPDKCFSVLFTIKNYYKNNIIPNAINIQNISYYGGEKEYLFLPFSFYYFKDIKIDLERERADIYLETIGKREILENQIKKGKEIEYNERENLMKVKNN